MGEINPLVRQVFEKLSARGETISFAESCTGGLISSELTLLPGISKVFWGSVVCYANEVKENILGVRAESLKAHGAVSALVAQEMARGARERLKSNWAVSVTGIAGPSGGSAQKPVGLVFFGISGPNLEHVEYQQFKGDRGEIQAQTCDHALTLLLRYL